MLLSDEEHFAIILATIRDYEEGKNDIPILMVEKICKHLLNSVDKQIDTQEIYDEIIECFSFYNDFIKEKDVDLKTIPEEFYDLVELYINEIVKEMKKNVQ